MSIKFLSLSYSLFHPPIVQSPTPLHQTQTLNYDMIGSATWNIEPLVELEVNPSSSCHPMPPSTQPIPSPYNHLGNEETMIYEKEKLLLHRQADREILKWQYHRVREQVGAINHWNWHMYTILMRLYISHFVEIFHLNKNTVRLFLALHSFSPSPSVFK